MKILIVDDHAVIREGLKYTLKGCTDFDLIGEAESGVEAINKMRKIKWDVVLLDISMPGKSGLDVMKQMKKEQPELQILILSVYPEDQYAIRMLRAGAAGYMSKGCDPDELVQAIRKVANGGKYINNEVADSLLYTLDPVRKKALHQALSDREYQVFQLMAEGKQVSEIAHELSISDKTASNHRQSIMKKMNMKKNAEIVRYAIKCGIVR